MLRLSLRSGWPWWGHCEVEFLPSVRRPVRGCRVAAPRFSFFFFNFIFLLFLAALGLCCCVQAFSGCDERGLLFIAVRRLLIAVAPLVAEHRL